MITFKTTEDLSQLPLNDPTHAVIHDLLHHFPRNPESQGYIVLVESGDTHVNLPELESCIAAIDWDGVYRRDNYWIAIQLTNNEFALEFVFPDAEWLDADLRASLENQAQESASYLKDIPF